MNFNYGVATIKINGEEHISYKVELVNTNNNSIYYTFNTIANTKAECLIEEYFIPWKVNVYANEVLVEEYNYNANNKNIRINLDSSALGDNIAWIPYLEEFRKKHNCNLFSATGHNTLFETQYKNITFVSYNEYVNNLYATYNIGLYYIDDTINYNKHPSNFYNLPLQKICSDILGLEYKVINPGLEYKVINPGLEYKVIDPKILENKKQVCLGIHGSGQLKYWNNPRGWQTVIDWLNNKGYAVKVLSSEGQKYDYYLNNVTFHPAGNIEYVIKELKESVAFIGICSGLSWLSWATDTKTIIIDGYSSKLTFPETCIHISPPADKCQGCFHKYKFNKDDWYFCPEHKGTDRQFECTKSITANMVIDKLKEILQ
jgi:autotransporter strand-loop-strand O-heptosyltransferase